MANIYRPNARKVLSLYQIIEYGELSASGKSHQIIWRSTAF